MYTRLKLTIPLLVLLTGFFTSCGTRLKFVAPEIDPPTDLIPGYVPAGFELISGFQLSGEITLPELPSLDETGLFGRLAEGNPFFEVKSPAGNVIQGVYYQGKDHLLLITKSYFPKGNMDDWLAAYEAAQPKPCECDCPDWFPLRAPLPPDRINQLQEVQIIDGTRVAILKGPQGWITIFVRGDYLLSVESGISIEENLKIVASLLSD